MSQFVHLRVHTEYSLVDGVVRVPQLMKAVAAAGMPAVALTDQSNLFAMVKFYSKAQKQGIKPIIGVDVQLREADERAEPSRLTLLAQDYDGYRNMTRLVSRAYLEGQQRGIPMLEREWLDRESTSGVIALSGAREGDVGRALLGGRAQDARELLRHWLALFGDRYYLEIQRTGRPGEEEYIRGVLDLLDEVPVPVVATNDVRFLEPDDFEAHEARVCIRDGMHLNDPGRARRYTDQQYLRTPEEMAELFADLPEALENSVEIARRCSIDVPLGKSFLPEFPVPKGMTTAGFLRTEALRGLEERLATLDRLPGLRFRPLPREDYDARLGLELEVICQMGFEGYFLIVADFIRWARDNEVPVGPGRGSGVGSLVAYALGITDLDPLQHDLLFERFLNPERVSMPDFDIDFCMEKRDRVIDYVARTYGRDKVSQIITFGTMAAKAVVRDVGRVLGHPYGFVDSIAKLIPFELGITLDDALGKEPELKRRYEEEDEVRDLIDLARSLEGLTRNAGTHAGGVVIAPSVLTDFSALFCEQGSQSVVTQFDKDDVEKVGLVKFDFLGLRTLTIIDSAVNAINAQRAAKGEPPLDMAALPLDDAATYSLFKSCRTTAVFQLESRGMKELIKKMQPDCFEDIVALVALFRPGPLQSGMVDDFIARKKGDAEVTYPHPSLEKILKPTYGVIVYQEQVMQIAQVLAGYTLGGADLLRRAMGKKKAEEMAKQRAIFLEGSGARGVDPAVASGIFDLMEKFAEYGFNKSHSAAYALVSYQTMWLKAHYPAAFMAAVLSADMDNTDKVVPLIDECSSMGLEVRPPRVNDSEFRFTIDGPKTVVYGLGAIKGVGEAAIEGMLEARGKEGAFKDLFDFCGRIDLRKANRRVLETLIRAGALDGLGDGTGFNRATLMAQLPLAIKTAEQRAQMNATGQNDLFGLSEPAQTAPDPGMVIPEAEEWDEETRLRGEKETLGLYLTGHPAARYAEDFKALGVTRISDLVMDGSPQEGRRRGGGKKVTVAGLSMAVGKRTTQRGRMGSVTLDDRSGRIEVVFFNEAFEENQERLKEDRVLIITGTLSYDEYRESLSVRGEHVMEIEQARSRYAHLLRLRADLPALAHKGISGVGLVRELDQALGAFKGGSCAIRLTYRTAGEEAAFDFGAGWRVNPTDELLRRLERLLGADACQLEYRRPMSTERGGES